MISPLLFMCLIATSTPLSNDIVISSSMFSFSGIDEAGYHFEAYSKEGKEYLEKFSYINKKFHELLDNNKK